MRAAVVGVLLLALTACGVPRDDAPRALDPADAPFSTSASPAVDAPDGRGRVALYFVRDGSVVLARRPVARSTPVDELLDLLLAGPTAAEAAAGLSSAVPGALTVERLDVVGDVGVVTLRGPQDQALPDRLAFAQIVATLTAPGRLAGVRFRTGDRDLPVPDGDSSLTEAPLDRDDYAGLLAPTPSAPAS